MTVPIVSLSHEGIRININGVVSVFANPAYLAESYALLAVNAKESVSTVKLVSEELDRLRDEIPRLLATSEDDPKPIKNHLDTLADRIDTLAAAVADMQRRVG